MVSLLFVFLVHGRFRRTFNLFYSQLNISNAYAILFVRFCTPDLSFQMRFSRKNMRENACTRLIWSTVPGLSKFLNRRHCRQVSTTERPCMHLEYLVFRCHFIQCLTHIYHLRDQFYSSIVIKVNVKN